MIEDKITKYLVRCAKFEFYLINRNPSYAMTEASETIVKIQGVDWNRLAVDLEKKHRFANFEFHKFDFEFFKENCPQYLTLHEGRPKWDSEEVNIQSWNVLLTRSFAQLRNNVAHGNKSLLPSPFTMDRTEKFLLAGNSLMDFIVYDLFHSRDWDGPIYFS